MADFGNRSGPYFSDVNKNSSSRLSLRGNWPFSKDVPPFSIVPRSRIVTNLNLPRLLMVRYTVEQPHCADRLDAVSFFAVIADAPGVGLGALLAQLSSHFNFLQDVRNRI